MIRTQENGEKPHFGLDLGRLESNLGRHFFFMVSYHQVQYQKKLMIKSWENLVTDWQMNESDFIERCPTNVQRPVG